MVNKVTEKNLGGRPATTQEEKKEMLSKVEPYLKSGLSVKKTLMEAGIPTSSFYKLMDTDEVFKAKVEQYRQFTSILLNNAIVRHLQNIIKKQNELPESGKRAGLLAKEDIDFLKWFATTSNLTREEYGERKDVGFYDPEAEIQRLARIMDSDEGDEEDGDIKALEE